MKTFELLANTFGDRLRTDRKSQNNLRLTIHVHLRNSQCNYRHLLLLMFWIN